MKYTIDIAGMQRELPLCRLSDDTYLGAFILFGDVEITVHAAKELLKRAPEFDYLFAPEAKAIPLLYEMSRQSGKKYFLARKKKKLYMQDVIEVTERSITTEGEQKLFLGGADAKEMCGKRVVLLDDVISTGESMKALEALAARAGANVVARMGVLAEGASANRTDITFLQRLPLFNADGTPKN